MKKLVIFLIGLVTVFSLSAQRLNSRGEKMVSHIKGTPMYYDKYDHPYGGASSYDIYFSYDTNDEIRKVKIVAPEWWYIDSVVLIKEKKGITWKNYYNKKCPDGWNHTYKIFLDEEGRVSRIDDIIPRSEEYVRIFRNIYHYIDEPNKGDVCLDVDMHILYRFHDGREVYDGMESDMHMLRAKQLARYDGGFITDRRIKDSRTGKFDKYGAQWWEEERMRTIITDAFPNETNVELYQLIDNFDLLLLPRWIPFKADYLPLEYGTKYTDCIYNRNGDLTTIEIYTNSSYVELHGIFIQKIEIEYVQ